MADRLDEPPSLHFSFALLRQGHCRTLVRFAVPPRSTSAALPLCRTKPTFRAGHSATLRVWWPAQVPEATWVKFVASVLVEMRRRLGGGAAARQ